MTIERDLTMNDLVGKIRRRVINNDLAGLSQAVTDLPARVIVDVCERLSLPQRAVMFRMLPKQRALEVFEALDPALQRELLQGLQDAEVSQLFAELDPDDRVRLVDELPAALATRLLRNLPDHEMELTAEVLGYPQHSIGRRMSPEYVSTHPQLTVAQTLDRVRDRLGDAETVYTLPVLGRNRRVVGIVSLRDLIGSDQKQLIGDLMNEPQTVTATEDSEEAARRCTDLSLLALPVVDSESRIVGILTVDDAIRILEHEESEDSARQGGVEPLRRPYLSTPVLHLVRSRVVWLLVLAIGATLTVQVLTVFESTLEQVTVLALFVPLLIGTGGNTGNQAATTLTRALALGDVRPRDLMKVLGREIRVGFLLGLLLGGIGFTVAAVVYDPQIGLVIGLTLTAVCTLAASIGGIMPLVARKIRVDPAVFSNPFITTFLDASGLIVYFLIATAVLGI